MTGQPPRIVFDPLHEDVSVPERATELSAGYDLRAYLRVESVSVYRAEADAFREEAPLAPGRGGAGRRSGEDGDVAATGSSLPEEALDGPRVRLEPGDRILVPTGFRARLPRGYEAQIRIRSSLAWKRGLIVPNAPGTIDADYPDEWFVLIQNASPRPQPIAHGERVAQAVVARHRTLPWSEGEVGRSTERTGGFGSTS